MGGRIVITGTGMVTAAGIGVDACWSTLCSGRSAIGPVTLWDPSGMAAHIAGEVPGWPDVPDSIGPYSIVGRPMTFGSFAAIEALEQAGIGRDSHLDIPPSRRAVVAAGGFDDQMLEILARAADSVTAAGVERFEDVTDEQMMPAFEEAATLLEMDRYSQTQLMQALAWLLGAQQALTVSTACAGGSTAIGDGVSMMRRGEADVVLALGVDTLITREMMGGFCNLTALSTRNDEPQRASRPFDAQRDGFVMGEGAAAVVLEREEHAIARGATIVAELAGFGYSSDAFRLTAPHPEGTGMAVSMERAIADGGMTPADIGYINAHGTSTAANDSAETTALKLVFGDRATTIPVSGTKSIIGHLIHGAGAVGAVVAARTVAEQTVHPTANYEYPDPACDLNIVASQPRSADVDGVLVNAFGFGGQNATVAVRRWTNEHR
jgi:3-oxoacyl-[acyl-carrier-protein] synthase II